MWQTKQRKNAGKLKKCASPFQQNAQTMHLNNKTIDTQKVIKANYKIFY